MSNEPDLTFPEPTSKEEFYQQVEAALKPKKIKGLTEGQKDYLDAINESIITFCVGPAGSGKTFIPVVRAIELLQEGLFKKIVITRPNVECGNSLGFLPGKEDEKIAPYMRPIRDIFCETVGLEQLEKWLRSETVEFCSLNYMRGRSINSTIMILDEAQNAQWEELVMFLTRIGKNSKMIISGDETQKDTFGRAYEQCVNKFDTPPLIEGTDVVVLTEEDIVRNSIIAKIISKMGEYDKDYFRDGNTYRQFNSRRRS